MSNIFSRLRDMVGLSDPVDYDDDYEEYEEETAYRNYQQDPSQATPEEDSRQRRRVRERITVTSEPGTNVIGMPGQFNSGYEVVVMEPRSFEEMPQAIQALRERKSVVLNLTMMEPDQAQRAVDFVAGGTYAMDGHQERVGESIFLFTPICVQVTSQSGILQEVSQTQIRSQRVTVPTPAWTAEATRIAQTS